MPKYREVSGSLSVSPMAGKHGSPASRAQLKQEDNMSRKVGITIFSLIETAGVIVWLAILKVQIPADILTQVIAGVALFAFYEVEHVVAFNVGRGAPLLMDPDEPYLRVVNRED